MAVGEVGGQKVRAGARQKQNLLCFFVLCDCKLNAFMVLDEKEQTELNFNLI